MSLVKDRDLVMLTVAVTVHVDGTC